MPDEAFIWMGRIKAVEREFRVIRFGTDRLLAAVTDDPSLLERQLKRLDVTTASRQLEGTYVIRVFSEFETALIHLIRALKVSTVRGTEARINRVRDRGRIPQAITADVHKVREYRNSLVHERSTQANPVSIRESTADLCMFLSRLQGIW
jgi:hypothetical protein